MLGAALAALALAAQVRAAQISNVTISDVSTSTATIDWSTDIKTDATIHYGLDPSVGVVRDPTFTQTAHSLTLTDLLPATTYYFQVLSADDQGNTSATAGLTLTTQGTPAQRINTEIAKLTTPQDISAVEQQVKQTAAAQLSPPTISGMPAVTPTTDGATITWTTDHPSDSEVSLGTGAGDYTITQGNPNESVTDHSVDVIGLQASTLYHFQVSSTDSYGLTGTSDDETFTTKSIIPKIQNLKLSNVSETVATVSWSTGNVLASGEVDYTDLRTKKTLSMGDPAFITSHKVELTGLTFGTKYTVVVHARNQGGDDVASQPITFITVRDTVPPVISKVDNQSTLFPSDNVRIQTIISWLTDEPAYCQLFYIQGIVRSANNPPSSQPIEANPLTDHTLVIVGLAPSAVYKYWVVCHDPAGNQSQSNDFVLITPDKQKNIVDLILQNFQGTFGWVNNIGK